MECNAKSAAGKFENSEMHYTVDGKLLDNIEKAVYLIRLIAY
jgi:hypothetical protein